jgi:diguanylate cyclase
MTLRIATRRELWLFTAIITALTVMIPLVTVASIFAIAPSPYFEPMRYQLLAVAAVIPLFITPPVAYVVLSLIKSQTETIRMVDARIMFDMLTGALNRNHFLDSIRASQANGPLMIVDADHFKAINDTHGHAIGDEALRILSNALQKCVGEDGIVGRLGGEEFGIFLSGKSEAEGNAKAEAICAAVRDLHPLISGTQLQLTVSIGCGFHRAAKVIGHSLKEADDLLYRAKAEGRDRAVLATTAPIAQKTA